MKAFKLLFFGLLVLLLLMGLNPGKSQASSALDFFRNIFQSFKPGFVSQPAVQNDTEAIKKYYQDFADAADRANFTYEETQLILKNKDNRVLFLEELIEKAAQGENLSNLKTSFELWHQLDERFLSELRGISATNKTLSFHQETISWFDYHSRIAKQFSEQNLSKNQISQLAKEFKKQAEVHNLKLRRISAATELSNFSFIPQTEASTCAAFRGSFYYFGGRITLTEICNPGIVDTILLPCGGKIFFSWPVLAINPYLYHNVWSGAVLLGKSTVGPGSCVLGYCPYCSYHYYGFRAIFFGSSLE